MPQIFPRVCPECGKEFTPKDDRSVFCVPAHKRLWNNRMLTRAAPLMLSLQAWRAARHIKGGRKAVKHAFAELCLAIDAANAADKAAGRPSAVAVLEGRYRRQGLGGLI